ncbi:MAG: tetratricopeptide repeat protein [Candidatus Amulumruptor caecigallinarius]|nr:tetratricopeptide repeat protein [Candidatus Amulumruptor caecigallinarius]
MRYSVVVLFIILSIFPAHYSYAKTSRQERRLIMQGNKQYDSRKYVEAASIYEEAIKINPASAEAKYNLGLSQIRQVAVPSDTTPSNKALLDNARKNLTDVASLAKVKPGLAAKANYNLGNLEFNSKDFQKAIEYYKQALRIDPNDNAARKNLRIAQKNLQKQNNDKNNKNQQDNKKENKDKQDQQQQQNQNQNQNQQDKQQDKHLSEQAAARILQAVDNKENQVRARVNKASKGEKSNSGSRSTRKW